MQVLEHECDPSRCKEYRARRVTQTNGRPYARGPCSSSIYKSGQDQCDIHGKPFVARGYLRLTKACCLGLLLHKATCL